MDVLGHGGILANSGNGQLADQWSVVSKFMVLNSRIHTGSLQEYFKGPSFHAVNWNSGIRPQKQD